MNEAGLPFSIAVVSVSCLDLGYSINAEVDQKMTETRRISYDGPEPTHGGAHKT
jgi:hypothetical protein